MNVAFSFGLRDIPYDVISVMVCYLRIWLEKCKHLPVPKIGSQDLTNTLHRNDQPRASPNTFLIWVFSS